MKCGTRKLLSLTYFTVWSWDNLRLAYKYAPGGKRGVTSAIAKKAAATRAPYWPEVAKRAAKTRAANRAAASGSTTLKAV